MDELIAQPTRKRILEVVVENPGASARDIQRRAGLGWGETAYHLDQLIRAGALRRERGGRRDYYFPATFTWEDRRLFQALRSEPGRRLLLEISARPNCTLNELHEATGLTLSTTSFHLRHLLFLAVVEGPKEGNLHRYRALQPNRVAELVAKYRASFEDRLVDRFVESWTGFFGG